MLAFAKTCPSPSEESGDKEDWLTNNALIGSWIKVTIDPQVRSNIANHDVACYLWEHIKKCFSVKNGQRVQRLKAELVTTRQKGLPIEAYCGKMMTLWTALTDFRQAKSGADLERERKEDKLHEFLMRLDETTYRSVKSNILSRNPLPTLDEAYQILVQGKDSQGAARVFEERHETMAFKKRLPSCPQPFVT